MTERNRTAVHVDLLRIPAHVLVDRARLRGERFVDFHQIDLVGRPARFFSALREAGAGPMPITFGSTPTDANALILASGVNPSSFAFASDITSNAAAPSFSPDALPAVTVPCLSNAGFSPDRASGWSCD